MSDEKEGDGGEREEDISEILDIIHSAGLNDARLKTAATAYNQHFSKREWCRVKDDETLPVSFMQGAVWGAATAQGKAPFFDYISLIPHTTENTLADVISAIDGKEGKILRDYTNKLVGQSGLDSETLWRAALGFVAGPGPELLSLPEGEELDLDSLAKLANVMVAFIAGAVWGGHEINEMMVCFGSKQRHDDAVDLGLDPDYLLTTAVTYATPIAELVFSKYDTKMRSLSDPDDDIDAFIRRHSMRFWDGAIWEMTTLLGRQPIDYQAEAKDRLNKDIRKMFGEWFKAGAKVKPQLPGLRDLVTGAGLDIEGTWLTAFSWYLATEPNHISLLNSSNERDLFEMAAFVMGVVWAKHYYSKSEPDSSKQDQTAPAGWGG